MEAFKRGETAIAGKDTEYNAPNTALVGETLTLTADSTDGKATDFKIGGAFYYDDYDNTLSEGIGRRKDIQIVPNIIFVSEAGMERLTKEPIISAIGVDIKNFNDLERIDSELQAINSTLTGSEWQLRSSVNQKELFEQMNYSLSLLGNGAAILLIVIGLINFVNVMLTGVVARKMNLPLWKVSEQRKADYEDTYFRRRYLCSDFYSADYDFWQCVPNVGGRCSSAYGKLCSI